MFALWNTHILCLSCAPIAYLHVALPLCHADLRSNAARHAAGVSSSGSPINNSELLRRLRETQALLVKFSEENGRLARDNEKLQVCGMLAGVCPVLGLVVDPAMSVISAPLNACVRHAYSAVVL